MGSKQDFTRCFIEVYLKVCPSKLDTKDLQANLRQCLLEIIQGVSYPKQLFTFQVHLVKDLSGGEQAFAALLNACIYLLN